MIYFYAVHVSAAAGCAITNVALRDIRRPARPAVERYAFAETLDAAAIEGERTRGLVGDWVRAFARVKRLCFEIALAATQASVEVTPIAGYYPARITAVIVLQCSSGCDAG